MKYLVLHVICSKVRYIFKVAYSNILFSKNISNVLYGEDKIVSYTHQEKHCMSLCYLFRINC